MFWIQEGSKNQAAGIKGGKRWSTRKEQLGLTRSRTHSKDKPKAMAGWFRTALPAVQAQGGKNK